MVKTPSDVPLLALLLNVKTRHCIFHIGAYVKWTARRICDEADTGGVDDLSVKSSFMLDNRAVDDVDVVCGCWLAVCGSVECCGCSTPDPRMLRPRQPFKLFFELIRHLHTLKSYRKHRFNQFNTVGIIKRLHQTLAISTIDHFQYWVSIQCGDQRDDCK